MTQSAETVAGIGGMAASILIAIRTDPDLLIEHLAEQQDKSQSTVVRAVQQLQQRGLVEKRPGTDRRTVHMALTETGEVAAEAILDARAALIAKALDPIPAADRSGLERVVESMLTGLVGDPKEAYRMCRLCREECCGDALDCPVERGAARQAS